MTISEESVGIRAYTTTTEGFTAILRHRFTDFKVNEIDLDGNVVHLTSFDLPPHASDSHLSAPGASGAGTAPLDSPAAVAAAYEALLGAGAAAKSPELKAFLEGAQALKEDPKGAPAPAPLDLDPLPDKDLRRAVHGLFKALSWAPPLSTAAVTLGDAQQGVRVEVSGRGGDGRDGRQAGHKRKWGASGGGDAQEEWGGGSRKFLRFALYKENFDTHAAFNAIAKALRLPQKAFSVAGTKDKRGVTVQWATAFRVAPAKLARVNVALRGLRVGNFSYYPEGMRLGDLQGNRFEVVLRALSAPDAAAVEAAAAALRAAGFVNYYGLQRFGSGEVPTHHVGRALLRGEWEEAVRAILTPPATGRPEVAAPLRAFLDGSGSPDAALGALPRSMVAERAILEVLAKEGAAATELNALCSIPRGLRTMYVHAYQSYLWNEAASERVRRHGAGGLVEGDLVIPRAAMQAARRAKAAGAATEGGGGAGGEPAQEEEELAEVEPHMVTAEEAAAGAYPMEDLVLPLPGSRVRYPGNDVAEVYKATAERDGVSLEGPSHRVKEFSQGGMPGTYRHVLCVPRDLEYETLRYDDPQAELARTDLDALGGRGGGAAAETGAAGRHLALRLAFSLPSSTYATMLVRELTKMPTTVDFARSLKHP